jgi:hypothetical protein
VARVTRRTNRRMEDFAWNLPVNFFRRRGLPCCPILMCTSVGMTVGIKGTLEGFVYVCKFDGFGYKAVRFALTTTRATFWFAIREMLWGGESNFG